jgi:WXXGXW repeat (2 copies)
MLHLRWTFAALLIGAGAPIALTAPALAQACACAPGAGASEGGYVIQADEPPPPLPEYDQPPIPAPGYYWTPGYWAWNNYDYYWVPGAWIEPPQAGLLWTPGYWAFVGGVYAFRPGYWGQRVGFYGGIDYGFGYSGAGYQGGRWDNGRFFYNTTVNNIGAAHIANVYNQPVVANATTNRASFNGAAGGVVAKPTNEELLAEKEQHVRPTKLQTDQARASGMRSEQFVSTNRGKPAIAATARPGEFKGKGVVPAKAAGKAAEATPPPTGNVPAETKEKPPTSGQPVAPVLPPNAPKPVEKPSAAEKPVKPEAAPNAPKPGRAPTAVEKLGKPELAPNAPKVEQKAPAAEKLVKPEAAPGASKVEQKPPAVQKLVKPEPAPNAPKVQENRPAIEKPVRPEPPTGAQGATVHPPAQAAPKPPQLAPKPQQPAPKPEAKECGRPGQPACPK